MVKHRDSRQYSTESGSDLVFAKLPDRYRSLYCTAVACVAIVLIAWLDASCSKTPTSAATNTLLPAMQGLTATLDDEIRDLPDGKIAWSTYWKLCWAAYPEAIAYELQAMTAEGSSQRLRRLSEQCFRLQSAAGENKRSQGFLNRDLQLALQSGQLAYRVRAVLKDGRLSEWSPALAVGKEAKP